MNTVMFILLVLTGAVGASAKDITIYCGEWPVYCSKNEGFYFDLATEVYGEDIVINKVVQPYKRAISSALHNEKGIIFGTYKGEVKELSYSTIPISIDVITAYMLRKHVKTWQGVSDLNSDNVLLQKFWKLNEELNLTTSYTEIENREIAYKLISMGRYKYFITDSSVFRSPPKGLQMVLIKTAYMYPAFYDGPNGDNLKRIWERRIIELYFSGKLFELYSRNSKLVEQWEKLEAYWKEKGSFTDSSSNMVGSK